MADIDGNFVVADGVGTFDARAPYVVTNADDAGPGSLRDAIIGANGSANPDTIEFSPTFFNTPRTIDLLTALPTFPATGGNLTIAGPGEANLTVRRAAAAPGFRVFPSQAPDLTPTGFTVSNGNAGRRGGRLATDRRRWTT